MHYHQKVHTVQFRTFSIVKLVGEKMRDKWFPLQHAEKNNHRNYPDSTEVVLIAPFTSIFK